MNWTKFLTYGDSHEQSFESLCNQLFERHLKRTYQGSLTKFRVINGAGGDGGIEAYGQLNTGDVIAVQAKWFRQALGDAEIKQIRKSILTAIGLRPKIREYIICIPHNVNSLKLGKGRKPTRNHEEAKINSLIDEINDAYPDLVLTWWFDNEILIELQQESNEGIHKFWFDKEVISIDYLVKRFSLQKKGWLNARYIPELHGQGVIHSEYKKVCFAIEYRTELINRVAKVISDIRFCLSQIEHFIPINEEAEIGSDLTLIKENLVGFLAEFQKIGEEIRVGNELYIPTILGEVDLWKVKLKLEKQKVSNLQKNILPRLISSLDSVHKYNLPEYMRHFASSFNPKLELILGEAGTGKTHGLANCVEIHLADNSPALIIRAKGTPFRNWTEILSDALEDRGWGFGEVLSALEALAIKCDVKKATGLRFGEESVAEVTKAIICVDGLEEEIENADEWSARIRECEKLVNDYPRVRFLFSARNYFYNFSDLPTEGMFQHLQLPREGDVHVNEIAPLYFSKRYYNIQLSSPSIIRGLDSLLALRLFCDEYKGRSLDGTDKIVTATRGLINLKIERLNTEFISKLKNRKGATRKPIIDALEIVANYFYANPDVEHDQLVNLISPVLSSYLDSSEIDLLLDYLSDNGFLIRFEKVSTDGLIKRGKHFYTITYQSLIEHVISEKIYLEIEKGSLKKIPEFLQIPMIRPFDFNVTTSYDLFETPPNERIIQDIVNNLFVETGRLIGEDGFLVEGLNEWEILRRQLIALSVAPKDLAKNFEEKVDKLFSANRLSRFYVLEYLILPSSSSSDSFFGADYLHQRLVNLSVFERDKIWSGLDTYELGKLNESERADYALWNHRLFTRGYGVVSILLEAEKYDERPLIFAWGLSNISQELRNGLRSSLTGWAIKNPQQFLLLLKKIFGCNDPQIQEDLASIALGVASKLRDKGNLRKLALWSLENIFNRLEANRNVIVRQGFRAIVERAFQYSAISLAETDGCRPKPMKSITLLPLELDWSLNSHGECYPIVHDLAWYVINKAYDDFLEPPTSRYEELEDNDCPEAQKLLNEYRNEYNDKGLFASNWSMSAAFAFIKNLGLTRTEGNWHTQATHGAKSKVFTYEEKYTWLAVHYIQGYLSDYVPLKDWAGQREFVKDYSQITDIVNPTESFFDLDYPSKKSERNSDWVIPEPLVKEIKSEGNLNREIANWVNEEPAIELTKWLYFDSNNFRLEGEKRKWLALYNHTSLHDSNEYCYSYIDLRACLVSKTDMPKLINVVRTNPDSLRFITRLDRFYASPSTDVYSNPIDIVWMTWIEEDGASEEFYDVSSRTEKMLYPTITHVVQNKVDGADYIMLPSKKVRNLIGCYELLDSELKDSEGETLAFNYKKSDGSYKDSQELVLVNRAVFEAVINKDECEVVWFVELFRQRNPLNEILDKDFHVRKTRKYLAWVEEGIIQTIKFWDEEASNVRDD